ncbi:MAG TPA: septal ring lytic transglycosylase RlpA family protein [Steroidobacteraceae bacterium]|nr:septal ring lytic transglycosylase RlpA family protein [Steroidobacteraceae bacterium]
MTTSHLKKAIAVFLCITLVGCSLARRKPDHPTSIPSGSAVPQPPPDVFSIPDAVPRVEPRGTRGNPPFYEVFGKRYYVLNSSEGFVERGTASWYGPGFHAQATSLGETYDMYAMTAAHKTLPLPAYAEVTNLRNGRKVVVRINDRGPFVGDRIIDLSYTAAAKLDMLLQGTAPVEVRVISPRSGPGSALPPVTPVAAPPPVTVVNAPATNQPAANSQVMFIQAGVFSDHENARRRVEVLLAAGIELASLDEASSPRALHRVRVGPFASVEEFDLNMRRLRELGITDARLLTD